MRHDVKWSRTRTYLHTGRHTASHRARQCSHPESPLGSNTDTCQLPNATTQPEAGPPSLFPFYFIREQLLGEKRCIHFWIICESADNSNLAKYLAMWQSVVQIWLLVSYEGGSETKSHNRSTGTGDAGVAALLTARTKGSFWFKAKRKELRLVGSLQA